MLRDLEVRIPDPYGGTINVSAAGEPFVAASTKAWTLPDLAPGQVERFYIDVQLLSANGATIFLQPENPRSNVEGTRLALHPSESKLCARAPAAFVPSLQCEADSHGLLRHVAFRVA